VPCKQASPLARSLPTHQPTVPLPHRLLRSKTGADYHYQTMRCNVDLLKLIQLGVTLSDEDGNLPDKCTWQFNFKFNTGEDMYAPDSIELLEHSGIDFGELALRGIDVAYFGELLITSGLVLFKDIKWISFHS